MSERRKFSRVVYEANASIEASGQHWPTRLLDLSLKGALVATPDNWNEAIGNELILHFTLVDTNIELSMNVTLCHQHDDHLGLKTTSIDIESATHLKRLVQLNVGDDELLHRELEQLVKQQD
ncbi:PilZ domain-containing protein [Motilimonas cestriensis]|uniref:Cyclic diguanosine monophosphate-binding protein n=1 Tax=Motilimonas cestriensis TaxID=2742685 RepID=A0ABS8W7D4_9GAMM|nr:PilZ domain-containing protein [Motilimonas cestriensis]MCE2594463.1 PilZ domain-containing protein [Motilimonas cestriensis]